jgi:hypothetical protein
MVKYAALFSPSLSELREGDDLFRILEDKVVGFLPKDRLRTVQTSESLSYEDAPSTFRLKSVGKVQSAKLEEDSRFEFQLLLKGLADEIVRIEGERALLEFLRRGLQAKRGATWDEIVRANVPASYADLQEYCGQIEIESGETWERVQELQTEIDEVVCDLYGVGKAAIDNAIDRLAPHTRN